MLDHVFVQAVGALRGAFDRARLEHHRLDERFQIDLMSGDMSWDGSFTLPGEGDPPRVVAEVGLEWSTWSQTAYRAWASDGGLEDPPEIEVEVVVRVQRLRSAPAPDTLLDALPLDPPRLGTEPLERGAPVVEQAFGEEPASSGAAFEVSYEGVYLVGEEALALGGGPSFEADLGALGGWVASALVRLGDLRLEYLPPEEAK